MCEGLWENDSRMGVHNGLAEEYQYGGATTYTWRRFLQRQDDAQPRRPLMPRSSCWIAFMPKAWVNQAGSALASSGTRKSRTKQPMALSSVRPIHTGYAPSLHPGTMSRSVPVFGSESR
ncbi:hypothetical protein SAMN04488074_107317 [Lentzea albidocapillata subsp. violacea]|uniref:Uncharacterized protein n=1 Tax=Lentzea albidocapillata subsp. violacea TaxID=128104 RepID=A0A1G9FCJ6_9PSEU|nr:hypothetical protein SAMN04488074_107317 [Lentzea albidocapillata subsp. violacea]